MINAFRTSRVEKQNDDGTAAASVAIGQPPGRRDLLFRRSQSARLLGTVPPAGVMTFGLFLAMGALISVDYQPADATESYVFSSITPEKTTLDQPDVRPPLRPIETLVAPPALPPLSTSKTIVDLPTSVFGGGVPTGIEFSRVPLPSARPSALIDRHAKPIVPPVPAYPPRALSRGIEGNCSVQFDVNLRGQPYNINADCSDSVFVSAAKRAVERAEFAPKIVRGERRELRNVVYPLVFALED